jgi:KUP system potassium uptake protein
MTNQLSNAVVGNADSAEIHHDKSIKALMLTALGVVYGDIGTSPLYTLREIFVQGGIRPDPGSILGALSLIFWTIFLVVTVKYVIFVLRADNKGEGGILALTALALRRRKECRRSLILLTLGIIGAALFYGDCVITPAISVLSAIEGLEIITPKLHHWVVPIALLILIALFVVQHSGTERVGKLFGPVMLIWFTTLGLLGALQIIAHPGVLLAISPHYAFAFLAHQEWTGFVILGAVVLCVTGGEALYADMGHFGRRPIRMAWFGLVWPALLLNYFGQGGLLIVEPDAIENPFYRLAPAWALYPMLLLAASATVIASQAVISGAYSLTSQAVHLGYLPRLEVRHTSAIEAGQIYVPLVNWLLLAAVIALVVGFASSSNLAAAYGIAVTGTMIVTTLLSYVVFRRYSRISPVMLVAVAAGFLVIDVAFFSANLLKVVHGGWFPLLIAVLVWYVMSTWIQGRRVLLVRVSADALPIEHLLDRLDKPPIRVARTAVYMTSNPGTVPRSLLHNLKHNLVLHERVILMKIGAVEEPRLADSQRIAVARLGKGFHTVSVRYGYMEEPDVPAALQACRRFGLAVDPMEVSYFLNRETLVASKKPDLPRWREPLFITLNAIAGDASMFFKMPPGQVVELGTQIEI